MITPPMTAAARIALAATFASALPMIAPAQSTAAATTTASEPRVHANWLLANRYSRNALRSVVFNGTVQPRWIGKTDSLFYNWKDRNGSRFTLVVPMNATKRPLFDHEKLAAALAMTAKKPVGANNLPLSTLNFTRDHKSIRLIVDSNRYERARAITTTTSTIRIGANQTTD